MINILGSPDAGRAKLGLRAYGNQFVKGDRVFRGIGVNHFALLLRQVDSALGTAVDYSADMTAIKQTWGLPFIRLAAGWYSRSTWFNKWYSAKAAYLAAFDAIVAKAEALGLGLIPCLFWDLKGFTDATYDVYGSRSNLPNLASKSSNAWALASEFVSDIVSRYRSSPAIWGWEIANEATGNTGPEYWPTWALDGTGVDGGSSPLPSSLNWGAPPEGGAYAAGDKMSMANYLKFSNDCKTLIQQLDGYGRIVISGNGQGNSFAVGAQTANSLTADTLAKWNAAVGAMSWPVYRDQSSTVISYHSYPLSLSNSQFFNGAEKTAAQMIALFKGWADAVNKPFFLGEFGATYIGHGSQPDEISSTSGEEATNFNAILSAITANDIQLSAAWNYGGDLAGASTWQYWKMSDATKTYQLTAIAAANAAMNN